MQDIVQLYLLSKKFNLSYFGTCNTYFGLYNYLFMHQFDPPSVHVTTSDSAFVFSDEASQNKQLNTVLEIQMTHLLDLS